MAQLFSRWRKVEFDFEGAKLTVKLLAPLMADGRDLQRRMDLWRRNLGRGGQGEDGTPASDIATVYEQVFGDEWAREKCSRLVRPDGELSVDEQPVTNGGELYDVLGLGERLALLLELTKLSFLGYDAGKVSSSPSTSAAGTGPMDAGGSPATSTGPADGPTP